MQTQYIAAWKSGVAVRWRSLTWSEYRQFKQQLTYSSPVEVYIDLYRAVLLEGPDVVDAAAGIVDFVGRSMLETNPFGGEYLDIAHALIVKRASQTYLDTARALVAGLFHYSFEEIDTWDADIFFLRVAQAEFLAGRALDPEDPAIAIAEAEAAKDPTKKRRPPQRPKKDLTRAQQMVLDRVQGRA